MADPRDTARRWLANQLRVTFATEHIEQGEYGEAADSLLADVEVTTILRPIDDSRRIALLLPVGEGEGT